MAENELSVRMKQATKTSSEWAEENPILYNGEVAYSSDLNNRYKVGDGETEWNSLTYSKAEPIQHNHKKSEISDFPTSLKNPSSLTIQGNGITLTNGTYDGSSAKTVNITPVSIGAAPSNHNHDDKYYTESEIDTKLSGKANTSHNHNYLPLSGGIVTGATQFNNYLKLNAWNGYGTGTANLWFDANNKFVEIQNATDLKLAGTKVSKEGHTHNNIVPIALTTEDLNTIKPNNVTYYYAGGSNSVVNNPFGTGTAFGMIVYKNAGGYITQEATSQHGKKKMRYWNSKEWTSWNSISTFTTAPTSGQVLISDGTDGGIKTSGYTIGKSVPSNAVFTDTNTHYASKNVVGSSTATNNTTSALANGSVYLNSVENGVVTSAHKISGSGATKVTTDASGNIIISSTDNNTTYGAAGSSLGLIKSGGDLTITNGVAQVNDDSHNHVIGNIDGLQSALDSKFPCSGGTFTNPNNIKYSIPKNTIIAANNSSVLQSPIPKYLWHDVFAFGNYNPTYYTTTNGTNWVETALNKELFAQKENQSVSVLTNTVIGARWVWENVQHNSASWMAIGFAYTNPCATNTIVVETSTDQSTWTTIFSGDSLKYNAQPVWFYVSGAGGNNGYLRLTITKSSTDTGKTNLASIKLLTSRWGNQGLGSEVEYPYTWDANKNVTFPAKVTASSFSGNIVGNASTATALTTSAGSTTKPIYFSGGKPIACTYTIEKSVPSDAKFTDTNTWRGIQNNLTSDSTTDSLSAAQGKVLKSLVDGKSPTSHTHSNYISTDKIYNGIPTDPELSDEAGTGSTEVMSPRSGYALHNKLTGYIQRTYLPLAGGTITGNLGVQQDKSIVFHHNYESQGAPNASISYTSTDNPTLTFDSYLSKFTGTVTSINTSNFSVSSSTNSVFNGNTTFNGAPTFSGGIIKIGNNNINGNIEFSDYSNIGSSRGTLYLGGSGAGLEISSCSEGIYPNASATDATQLKLGSASRKFGDVYTVSTSFHSDKKYKKDITNLKECDLSEKYIKAFEEINFVKFRWLNNNNNLNCAPASSRFHYGLIAQDIDKILRKYGIDSYDNGILKKEFFASNETNIFITGGYDTPYYNEDTNVRYDYSENTYNFKHSTDENNPTEFEIKNEILEKNLIELNLNNMYNIRNMINYILIENNSKITGSTKNNQPSIKVNAIYLEDKNGELTQLDLNKEGIPYYPVNKGITDFDSPMTSATYNDNEESLTINFNKCYCGYMIKVDSFNLFDYEKIILDVDYVSEYKVYLLPGENKNANYMDFLNNDDLIYEVCMDYNEVEIMALHALQQKTKNQQEEIDLLKSEIISLKEGINN